MFCSPASLQFPTNDTINSLTNDCLVNIFDFLPLKEQLRSGQTCRRWWPLVPTIAGQTHLVVRRLPFGQSEELSSLGKPKSSQVESALKSILPAYGPRLISVSFDGCELSAAILDLTALLCPRLECLDLGLFAESLSNFSDLSNFIVQLKKFSRLKVLKISGVTKPCVFDRDPIGAINFYATLSEVINNSSWPLVELSLSWCSRLSITNPHLTRLTIADGFWTPEQLLQICENSRNLEYLKLINSYWVDFSLISRLSRLTELNFSFQKLCNSKLAAICTGCTRLRRLTLTQNICSWMTGLWMEFTDFSPLLSLEFEELEIHSNLLADAVLAELKTLSLRKLVVSSRNVTSWGLSQLAKTAKNLEELRINDCAPNFQGVDAILRECPQLRTLTLNEKIPWWLECLPMSPPKRESRRFAGATTAPYGRYRVKTRSEIFAGCTLALPVGENIGYATE